MFLSLGKILPLKLKMEVIPVLSGSHKRNEEVERIRETFRHHQPPIMVGEYIGSGGFADVFRATSNYNGVTRFALKILRTGFLEHRKGGDHVKEEMRIKDIKKRFTNESYVQWDLSQSMSERVSQSVVQVFDHGEFDSKNRFRFILMEQMASTLRDFINDEKNFGPDFALNLRKTMIMTKIADLIHNVHQEGIIHRDIKPENIFFCRPEDAAAVQPPAKGLRRRKYELDVMIKLGDFGTVRWIRTYSSRYDGIIIGSQWYLSPEQIYAPDQIDARTDIYSFGIACYELLHKAFPKDVNPKSRNLLEKLATADPVVRTPPKGFEPLNRIILKCLRNVDERYQTMADVIGDLRNFLRSTGRQRQTTHS